MPTTDPAAEAHSPSMIDTADLDTLNAILARHQPGRGALLQVLRQMQSQWRHIPPFAIEALVTQWGLHYTDVRGVIGFYHFLSAEPRGHYTVYLADSVTDRMQGSEAILTHLCARLKVQTDITRADGLVSVHRTSCTGLCDQGPAGLINDRPLTRLTLARADTIADLILSETALDAWPTELFAVHNPIWRTGPTLQQPIAPGQALRWMLREGAEATLSRLRDASLRGRGGAGFATWRKWHACGQAPGPRAITCNADEGEPGTFKDRLLLMQWAHEVFEGMTLAALVTGAAQGILYLRGEYAFIEPHLREVLHARHQLGLLGPSILASAHGFEIDIHLGAGAYVCGEETALIDSIEGKRGIPRTRPPFPVEHGYLGMPTVNNNVETFVQAAQIVVHGAAWFQGHGTSESTGTRLLSISGDVARAGLYEVPWGITVAEVLADCGASDVQAVLIGGPSGHLIDASQLLRRLSFEDLPTGGAFTVFNNSRDMVDVARQYTHFFAHESCGFCTPCRVGCGQLVETADRLMSGHASERDIMRLRETGELMKRTSHCGLGQTAANPLLDVIMHFPAQVKMRLVPDSDAFDLDAATIDMDAPPIKPDAKTDTTQEARA